MKGLYYGFTFLVISFFKNNFSKIILIPILFVTSEILRESFAYGFPWITFALVHAGNTFTLNLIYYIGTYGSWDDYLKEHYPCRFTRHL